MYIDNPINYDFNFEDNLVVDLLKKCLVRNSFERITIDGILAHPLFKTRK